VNQGGKEVQTGYTNRNTSGTGIVHEMCFRSEYYVMTRKLMLIPIVHGKKEMGSFKSF
jgi:hypothetical protein